MAVYTVSQVTGHLRLYLESDAVLADLWVMGEVSNLRVSAAGHSYFTLKDGQGVLNCVMFKNQQGADLLASGGAVTVHGHISFYEPRGSVEFMVDLAMPQGVGELSLELERLKLRLEADGLFEVSRKRPMPRFPKIVGIVTSPSGAVFYDIQNIIRRRYPLAEILLSPTVVQGAEAAPQVAAAINRLNQDGRADVAIVARGGGSLEELWAFNEEIVARAIFASRIPVVSAIGHETDRTIADLVADVRAPTPSAAAELVVPDGVALRQELAELSQRCRRSLAFHMEHQREELDRLMRRLQASLPDLEVWCRRVDDLTRVAQMSVGHQMKLAQAQVNGLAEQLDSLDPAATLKRGFAIVEKSNSSWSKGSQSSESLAGNGNAPVQIVTSASQVATGDPIKITVADGVIPAVAGHGKRPYKSSDGSSRRRSQAPMERLL